MSDPSTMQTTAGVIQGLGQLGQGFAQQQAHKFNARTAELNARIAQQQGARRERVLRRQQRHELGMRRAVASQAGLREQGSVMEIMADSVYEAELDAMAVQFDTLMEVTSLQSQSSMARMQGRSAMAAGLMDAGSSILLGIERARDMQ